MSKYNREIKPSVTVDVYDVLGAFTNTLDDRIRPCVDHAIKKLLATGQRGHKSAETDLREAIQSIQRGLDIMQEWSEEHALSEDDGEVLSEINLIYKNSNYHAVTGVKTDYSKEGAPLAWSDQDITDKS